MVVGLLMADHGEMVPSIVAGLSHRREPRQRCVALIAIIFCPKLDRGPSGPLNISLGMGM